MALGASQPWPEAMKALTGQSEMRAEPLLEYFQPLHDWLIEENRKNGEYIGWDGPGKSYGSGSSMQIDSFTHDYELDNNLLL